MSTVVKGDKVKVTYEGLITDTSYDGSLWLTDQYGITRNVREENVEVIDPVDSPFKDAVGTIREDDGGTYIKITEDRWVHIGTASWLLNVDLRGVPRIGTVKAAPRSWEEMKDIPLDVQTITEADGCKWGRRDDGTWDLLHLISQTNSTGISSMPSKFGPFTEVI